MATTIAARRRRFPEAVSLTRAAPRAGPVDGVRVLAGPVPRRAAVG